VCENSNASWRGFISTPKEVLEKAPFAPTNVGAYIHLSVYFTSER
jgi:hypothetical protein